MNFLYLRLSSVAKLTFWKNCLVHTSISTLAKKLVSSLDPQSDELVSKFEPLHVKNPQIFLAKSSVGPLKCCKRFVVNQLCIITSKPNGIKIDFLVFGRKYLQISSQKEVKFRILVNSLFWRVKNNLWAKVDIGVYSSFKWGDLVHSKKNYTSYYINGSNSVYSYHQGYQMRYYLI